MRIVELAPDHPWTILFSGSFFPSADDQELAQGSSRSLGIEGKVGTMSLDITVSMMSRELEELMAVVYQCQAFV